MSAITDESPAFRIGMDVFRAKPCQVNVCQSREYRKQGHVSCQFHLPLLKRMGKQHLYLFTGQIADFHVTIYAISLVITSSFPTTLIFIKNRTAKEEVLIASQSSINYCVSRVWNAGFQSLECRFPESGTAAMEYSLLSNGVFVAEQWSIRC